MNIFGHYVDRRIVAMAGLDGLIFLLPLVLLSLLQRCTSCGAPSWLSIEPYQAVFISSALLLLSISLGLYNGDAARDLRTFVRRFLLSWEFIGVAAIVFLAFSGAAAGYRLGWGVGLVVAGFVVVMSVQFGLHLALGWWLARPSMKRRVLVLGESSAASEIADYLNGPASQRFEHLQTVRNWAPAQFQPTRMGNVLVASAAPEHTPLSCLAEALRSDAIVVAVEDRDALPAEELLECRMRGIEILDAMDFWEREAGLIHLARAEPAWLAFSEGFPLHPRRRRLKRLVDVTFSLAFLICVLPLCALVALAIWVESPGAIFYRQERVGLNGQTFKVWKFRSMRPDAERDGAPRWASATDERVTRIGRFIRKVRIDEIPQVLNVLAGEMSFIGPRPERPFFVEQLREQIPHYDLRHRVPPGITGWAQVNYPYGASVEDAKRKLAYDLYYLKRNDLLLDALILLQTIRVVLFAHGSR